MNRFVSLFCAFVCGGLLLSCGDDDENVVSDEVVEEAPAPESVGGTIGTPVNLGLSVAWANHNIGVSCVGGGSVLFAWGETQPKDSYTKENYKWATQDKYSRDEKWVLDPEDDAATVNWGKEWKMPTPEELRELFDCDWVWTDNYKGLGACGYVVTGPNKKSIFVDAVEGNLGAYPSNSLYTFYEEYGSECSNVLSFSKFGMSSGGANPRYEGVAIRPVYVGK